MMNIDGIGEETAEMLYSSGLVKTIADLYDLTSEKLLTLERTGEKSVERIMRGIEDSKKFRLRELFMRFQFLMLEKQLQNDLRQRYNQWKI